MVFNSSSFFSLIFYIFWVRHNNCTEDRYMPFLIRKRSLITAPHFALKKNQGRKTNKEGRLIDLPASTSQGQRFAPWDINYPSLLGPPPRSPASFVMEKPQGWRLWWVCSLKVILSPPSRRGWIRTNRPQI